MLTQSQKIDLKLRESTLSLGDIKKIIPRHCFYPVAIRSWFTLFRLFSMTALMIYLESQTHNLLLLSLLWLIHGQVLVGLFVLGHDCGHSSFSRTRWINNLIGYVTMSPLGNGLMTWKLTHDHHHAHTQKRGQEVDWSKRLLTKEEFAITSWRNNFVTRLGYLLPFGIFSWVGWNAISRGMKKSEILNTELTKHQMRAVQKSNLIMLSVMICIYSALWYFTGIWGMIKYHGIPATIAMMTGYFLLIIQHANEESIWYPSETWTTTKGQLASTFDVRFPRVFEWMWLDINIHIPHHVAPNMPWYHLRDARLVMKSHYPELYQERKFSWKEIAWMIRTPYLKSNSENQYLQLSNVRES